MSSLYGPVVDDHHRHPRNRGALDAPDLAREGVNPLCGDRVRIELRFEDGRVAQARFDGEACMIALAAASVLTELVQGLTPAEASALPDEKLLAALKTQLRPSRVGCAILPIRILREGLAAL